MTVMAIFQDVDKCMRCGGCTTACKREWGLKNFDNISTVKPERHVVGARQRLAIKSQKRVDMGPFIRFSCWHCPDPPCAKRCPLGAITKDPATGAVNVSSLCDPTVCKTSTNQYPCVTGCQRGGYPKIGYAYEAAPTTLKMNKCTLCYGRAGVDDPAKKNMLPTTARKVGTDFISDISGLPVPELAHMPACVSTCPAKAMKWDTRDNILKYLNDNFIWGPETVAPGTKNWVGTGSVFWASKKVGLAPPKADPFIEDHVLPMTSSMLPGAKMIVPTLVVGGLAALSARRSRIETASTGGEVQE